MGNVDTDADTGADTVWLTYAELGRARGTNPAAAKRLAMRRRWRRQAGNDGTTRVSVPVSEAQHWKGDTSVHTSANTSVDTSNDTGVITSVIKVLQDAVASLTDRASAAEKRADQADIRANEAESRVHQAERALVEVEIRADRAESAKERLETDLEAAKIAQREAEANVAELREAVRKADHDRAAAVEIADGAVRAAEELRQGQASRAGQGRWARLRAAWLGE
jgi:hypothetical protein